eukprot:scaffold12861_cov179-Ochromonas_danica.AAC.1
MVRRLYVCDPVTMEAGIGWVIDKDARSCMVCGKPFGYMRWSHHCRCCGNLVCNACSPDKVEVVELQKLGPVRVCVLCYWGQHPVHASHNWNSEDSRHGSMADIEAEDDFSIKTSKFKDVELMSKKDSFVPPNPTLSPPETEHLIPSPLFVVEFYRKLNYEESGVNTDNAPKTRIVYVNFCMHDAMLTLPEEQEFVVCDEVYAMNETVNGKEEEAEVYHILLRPDVVGVYFAADIIEQFEEVASLIVHEVIFKFRLKVANEPRIISMINYKGVAEEMPVQLPACLTPFSTAMGMYGHRIHLVNFGSESDSFRDENCHHQCGSSKSVDEGDNFVLECGEGEGSGLEDESKEPEILRTKTPQTIKYPINLEWNVAWKAYLPVGSNVVFTSTIIKKNKIGLKLTRQLILTDAPSLIYVDTVKNKMKGSIAWSKMNPPKAAKVSSTTFSVTTTGRVYKFEDQESHNVDIWVERINATMNNKI